MNEGEIYTKMLLKDFRFQVNSLNTCSSEDSVKKADFIDAKRGEIIIQPFKNIWFHSLQPNNWTEEEQTSFMLIDVWAAADTSIFFSSSI